MAGKTTKPEFATKMDGPYKVKKAGKGAGKRTVVVKGGGRQMPSVKKDWKNRVARGA